jgi:hypothetical protein
MCRDPMGVKDRLELGGNRSGIDVPKKILQKTGRFNTAVTCGYQRNKERKIRVSEYPLKK